MAVSLHMRCGASRPGYAPLNPYSAEAEVSGAAPGSWRGTNVGWFSKAQTSASQQALPRPRVHLSARDLNPIDWASQAAHQLHQDGVTDESSEDISSNSQQSLSSVPMPWHAPPPVSATKVHYLWDAGEDSSSVSNSVVSATSSKPRASLPSRTGAGQDIAGSPADAGDGAHGDAEPQLSYSDFLIASRRDKDLRHKDMDYWLQRIPLNEKGHITSVGSIAHVTPEAKCKPCIFLSTPHGCERGRECPFCHLSHKFRMCKGKRDRTKRLLEKHEQFLAQQKQTADDVLEGDD